MFRFDGEGARAAAARSAVHCRPQQRRRLNWTKLVLQTAGARVRQQQVTFHFLPAKTNGSLEINRFIVLCRKYWVFRAWGRVGTTIGGNKLEDFRSDKEAAVENFEDLFLEKTGNEWRDRKNFVKQPRKFDLIDLDLGAVSLSSTVNV